jgi:ParB family chromosome partitioning protein
MSSFYDVSLVEEVPTRLIRPSTRPLRRELTFLDDLVESIRQHGLLQPIIVRPHTDWFEVVAGNRRFAACKSLRLLKVPCIVRELSDRQAFEFALTENVERKSLDPFEEAEAFRSYILDNGWGSLTDLATKLGKSPGYISQRMSLLKLPEKVREMIARGEVCVSSAREIARVRDSGNILLLASLASRESSSREIREYAQVLDSREWSRSSIDANDRDSKILRKHTLILKMAMARLTSLVERTQDENTREFLIYQRTQLHDMIDRAIHLSLKRRTSTLK